ncbi:tail fiber domain-containing protein [Chryseobacterium aurantiacum]|uniref:tail fiber domain-containing protein n=1 Tax=Chryseobacterium aurantiacum TaxID=2116499 RepID=UPI000D13B59E|nr:tail fiber domain-containing protein [Chryseobacterium aurantiacum]
MKKCLVAMLVSGLAYSQVGINTQTPKSTLDVMVNPTGSKPEGIIAPRMTGDALRSRDLLYTTDQNAALVYVTLADTAPAGKTINVTSPGYYYFDAAVTNTWIKLGTGGTSVPAGPTPAAWYPGGNTESSEKTLGTNNNFDLPFVTNGTEKARLTTSGSFGINTQTPQATLDVTLRPATANLPEGIIAPRITGNALKAKNALYLAAQNGTLVYVTTADTAPTGKTVNVTSPGYYYYDAATSIWIKLVTDVSAWKPGGNTESSEKTLGTNNNYDLPFVTNNTEKARLTKEGLLGVGTNDPAHGIHLVSTSTTDQSRDNIAISSPRNPAFVNIQTTPTAGETLGSFQFQGQGLASVKSGIYSTVEASGTSSSLEFLTSNKEQVRIDGKGFVGIGTDTPLSRLHIVAKDNATVSDNDIRLSSYKNGGDQPSFFFTRARGTEASPQNLQADDFIGLFRFRGEIGGSEQEVGSIGYQYTGNGTNTNGSLVLAVNNTIRATLNQAGTFNVIGSVQSHGVTLSSDARFKTDIATIKNALPIITSLRGTTYQMNKAAFPERHFADGKQYGVIAQEIEKVLPELVTTNEDGYKSVNYQGMIPVLIEAVKEQQKIIQQLQKDMEQLKK